MSGNSSSDDSKKDDQGKGGGGGDDKGFQPVTYKTQEELDAAFSERATRAANTAKTEALKAFQEAGATPEQALEAWQKVKADEEAKKDPAVKEREKNDRLQRELQEYKDKETRAALRTEVAKGLKVKVGNTETPIPADLLSGSNKDEMEASGKALIEFIGQLVGQAVGPRAPRHNPLQGTNGDDKVQSGDPLRNYMETGSFT